MKYKRKNPEHSGDRVMIYEIWSKLLFGVSGILRPAIRNLLKQHKQVSSYEAETEMQGGEGITLVEMRE
ncbi:MAG: Smr/MutS family protein [Bacteroidia bacterium]